MYRQLTNLINNQVYTHTYIYTINYDNDDTSRSTPVSDSPATPGRGGPRRGEGHGHA